MIAKLFSNEGLDFQHADEFLRPRRDLSPKARHRTPTPAKQSPTTEYKIAETRDELYSAFELVYSTYLRSNFTSPNRHRKRVSMFNCLETTDVFIAKERNRAICTLALIGDSELGIPMESLYPQEVNLKRLQGLRIAEVGALAQQDVGNFSVLLRLMQFVAQRTKHRGIDELLIVVHPRHVKFYQGFFSFEPIGPCRNHSGVCNQPAVAMALNLNQIADRKEQAPRTFKRVFGKPVPREQVTVGPLAQELRDEIYDLAVQIIDNGTSIVTSLGPARELEVAA